MLIGVFIHILYAQAVPQKMIVGAYENTQKAADNLYKVEVLFEKNSELKRLKQTEHLRLEMELLEPYVMVVIKPITSVHVKNTLHLLLQSAFPQTFTTIETNKARDANTPQSIKETASPQPREVMKDESFLSSINSEWAGLILLALSGLLLVARSAKQMSKIKSLQDEVSKYQNKVETEMHGMEKHHA